MIKERPVFRSLQGGSENFRQPFFDYLVNALESGDKRVQMMAAGMLGTLDDPGAAGNLKELAVGHDADLCAKSPEMPS